MSAWRNDREFVKSAEYEAWGEYSREVSSQLAAAAKARNWSTFNAIMDKTEMLDDVYVRWKREQTLKKLKGAGPSADASKAEGAKL